MTLACDFPPPDRPDEAAPAEPSEAVAAPAPAAESAWTAANPERLAHLFRRGQGRPHPLQPLLQAYREVKP